MNRSARYSVLALVLALGAGAAFFYRSASPPPAVPMSGNGGQPAGTSSAEAAAGSAGSPAEAGGAEQAASATLRNATAETTGEAAKSGSAKNGAAKARADAAGARRVKKPAAAEPTAPVITTTSPVPEYRAAEIKLARFINALQLDRRERAVSLLSSRVPEAARQALLARHWLNPTGGRPEQFERLLFVKDLQIRPRGKIQGDTLKLYVIPRRIPFNRGIKDPKKRSKEVIGYLEIPMRREAGEWRVELLPARTS